MRGQMESIEGLQPQITLPSVQSPTLEDLTRIAHTYLSLRLLFLPSEAQSWIPLKREQICSVSTSNLVQRIF